MVFRTFLEYQHLRWNYFEGRLLSHLQFYDENYLELYFLPNYFDNYQSCIVPLTYGYFPLFKIQYHWSNYTIVISHYNYGQFPLFQIRSHGSNINV